MRKNKKSDYLKKQIKNPPILEIRNSSKLDGAIQAKYRDNLNRDESQGISNIENKFSENKIGEDLLTKHELAQKLKYSVSYINKLIKQRKIPFLKNGRSVRFIYTHIRT